MKRVKRTRSSDTSQSRNFIYDFEWFLPNLDKLKTVVITVLDVLGHHHFFV